MNDKELTQLQETGTVTIISTATLADIVNGVLILGIDPRRVVISSSQSAPALSMIRLDVLPLTE